MDIRFIPVDKNNWKRAAEIQSALFPNDADPYTYESTAGCKPIFPWLSVYKSWIVEQDGVAVGITGFYAYLDYPDDAWGGYMGVLSGHRSLAVVKAIQDKIESELRQQGYKNLRLYTDAEKDATAVKLYEHVGMLREDYYYDDANVILPHTLIFSKSLTDAPVTPWNNKYLYMDKYAKYLNQTD